MPPQFIIQTGFDMFTLYSKILRNTHFVFYMTFFQEEMADKNRGKNPPKNGNRVWVITTTDFLCSLDMGVISKPYESLLTKQSGQLAFVIRQEC